MPRLRRCQWARRYPGPVTASGNSTRDALLNLTTELVGLADARGTSLRALGGLGIDLRATSANPVLRREFADIDVAAPRKARRQLTEVMEEAGLQGEPEFNALQGARRQIWWTPDRSTHVDVFLGEFRMCHRLDFDERLRVDHPALPAADLLLTKLQVLELNRKDVTDMAALLTTHRLDEGDAAGTINRQRIADVLSTDWGFYTTATDNLERIPGLVSEIDTELGRQVAEAAGELRDQVARAPKSRGFNLRAKVGRRKRWYEVPDESLT
jgi:hypothetical protein